MSLVLALSGALRAALRTRTDLALENRALWQQLALLRRQSKRPQFGRLDRLLWMSLSNQWAGWREALHLVRPETVIRWLKLGLEVSQRSVARLMPRRSKPPSQTWRTFLHLSEGHLRRRLRSYLRDYHGSPAHLALEKDAPEPGAVELPEHGSIVALPQVGGLHHRYLRRAA